MFIAIPVRMNYLAQRWPVVTLSLIGVNTLVFLVTVICAICTDGDAALWTLQNLWLVPAESHWWMYFTHMFVHGGIFHLAGNMIFLFLFGACVEDMIGRWKFLLLYLIGGLVAAFSYIAFSPEHFASTIPMGGASGAISACMGMYLILRADADIEFKYFIFFPIVRGGDFEIPAWIAIAGWFLRDLIGMIIGMFSAGPHHGGVAFGAHVGGLLCGCAMIGMDKLINRGKEIPEEVPIVPAGGQFGLRAQNDMVPAAAEATGEIPAIYVYQNGRQTGPFTLSQVQDMLRLGSIATDASYWSDGMADWQSVAELSG